MFRFAAVFTTLFFVSLHWGAILYVNSSLLGSFFSADVVSVLFLMGALGNIVLFLLAPNLIEHFGKHKLLLLLLFVAGISTLSLAVASTEAVVAVSFVIYASLIYIVFYCLDIFIEELSVDTITGEIRAAYIALVHLGLILGLLTLTIFSVGNALGPVYIAAAAILIVPVVLVKFYLKSPTPKWHGLHHHHALLPLHAWWKHKSVRRVTLARFSLELFYAFMTIYAPVYLHSVLGFGWSTIGIMFIVMLLPFILLQWPAGKLIDHFIGEKELMIVGFLFIGGALLVMPQLSPSIALWTIVLLLSRVGASLIEITTDSYFFKHVNMADSRFLSIFRLTRPASLVVGTTIGAVALNLFAFENIFFVLAVLAFFGLKESLLIRDTL